MITSSRFTVAVHALAMLALEQRPLSSPYIANSVNTNPVVIRRILGPLADAGFITTQLGAAGGATLAQNPESLTLLDVYRAVESGSHFALHSSEPNPNCLCGRNMQPILTIIFEDVQRALESRLQAHTIADVVQQIRRREPWLAGE